MSIGFGFCLRLRPDYPAADCPCGGTLRLSVVMVCTSLLCYSFRHSHLWTLHMGFRSCFVASTTLPYHAHSKRMCIMRFGVLLCPVEASAQGRSTSELLRTL